jgi:hypothetical protein
MDGHHLPHPGDAGICRGQLATPDEPGGKPARPRTSSHAADSPTPCSAPPPARSSAASISTRRATRARTILRRADGMRPSVPGSARTMRRLTRCSTTRSAPGWTATGRSARSSTRHGTDLPLPASPACYLPGGRIPQAGAVAQRLPRDHHGFTERSKGIKPGPPTRRGRRWR